MSKEPVKTKVEQFLNRYQLFGKTFVVGFSGGFDSMCLLDVLSQFDIKLVAAHYNHGWREEANAEEQNCLEFCKSRGIKFISELAPPDLKKTETEARKARYEFFQRCVENFNAEGIFTAHNSDDNAETVIYRIIKGTGITGLSAISEVRDNIYRPILRCSRAEIEEYCKIKGLKPNVDSSNADTKYKRNFIRHEILPKMCEINKDAKSAINKLSELAQIESLIVEEYLKEVCKNIVHGDNIDTKQFLNLSKIVQQRLLYSLFSQRLAEYDLKRILEIQDFIVANGQSANAVRLSLTTDLWLSVCAREIAIFTTDEDLIETVFIHSEGEYELGAGKLTVAKTDELPQTFPRDADGIAYVDLSSFDFPLELRYGRVNDEIKPLGMNGRMELKKYLSGRKVSEHLRDKTVVLAIGQKVLWVPYYGVSEEVKITNRVTHKIMWKETP